eukprot:881537-Prymnesium_polylepis.1
MLVAFVIDICVLIFAFWGAVFGIGIVGANPACDVSNVTNVTFAGNAQYPPKVNDIYVAEYCNLNQQMFNVCIKVGGRTRAGAEFPQTPQPEP